MEWFEATPDCEKCMNKNSDMCKTCFVSLDDANIDCVKVLQLCRHNYVTVGSGFPIAINVSAVKDTMDSLGIDDDKTFSRVIAVVNGRFIKAVQKKVTQK